VTVDSTGLARAAFWGTTQNATIQATVDQQTRSTRITIQPQCSNCGSWSSAAGMANARLDYATDAVNGIVYVAGGHAGYPPCGGDVNYLDAFDPAANVWTSKAPIPSRSARVQARAIGGLLYVIGTRLDCGDAGPPTTTSYAYDPSTNAWSVLPRMPLPGTGTGSDAFSGSVTTLGGIFYALSGTTRTLYAFDPSSGSWTVRAPSPHNDSATAVLNGRIVAFTSGSSTLEAYDPATDTWSARAPFPRPRTGAQYLVVGQRLYVIGGWCLTTGCSHFWDLAVDVFDASANTWTSASPLPAPAGAGLFAGVLNGLILVGRNADYPQVVVSAYDPISDKWEIKSALNWTDALPTGTAFVAGGRLLVPTSSTEYHRTQNSVTWIFTP
jgi:N-acetylneuraminic acid mutarotase